MDQAEPSVVVVTATKFFKYVRLTGWVAGDQLKSINIIDPFAGHLKVDLDYVHPHYGEAQEAKGFCVEILRSRDDLDQDIEIEFVGDGGWSHKSSFLRLADLRKSRDATAVMNRRCRECLESMPHRSERGQVEVRSDPKSFLVFVQSAVNHETADGYAIVCMPHVKM